MIKAVFTRNTHSIDIIIKSVTRSSNICIDMEFYNTTNNKDKKYTYPIYAFKNNPNFDPIKITVDKVTYVFDNDKTLDQFHHNISTLITLDNL